MVLRFRNRHRRCSNRPVMTDLRYPVGRFSAPQTINEQDLKSAIDTAALPSDIRKATKALTDSQLDTPYRTDGWTVRQVVHHVADSHMNALIRLKLALSEDGPTIKPYDENAWAALADARLPIDLSLTILDGVHGRWDALNAALTEADYGRLWTHPEHGKTFS